ncbi:endonuclease G [Bradyrhizobium sp. USDA 4472]
MPYFDQDKIHEIHERAVRAGLAQRREDLLAGLSLAFISELDNVQNAAGQMLRDLSRLNRTDPIDGEIPLERLLRNAAYLSAFRPDDRSFFRDRADEVTAKRPTVDKPDQQLREAIPERILFTSDMVSFGFLKGAELVGRGTARLRVGQIENDAPRTYTSGKPVVASGTCWLIGSRHVITNHHVVRARARGEAPPSAQDFARQAAGATVQFDYDFDGVDGTIIRAKSLCAADEKLDYAVLELSEDPKRAPLPLWHGPLELPAGSRMAVNIIQHPGGAAKQMALRNNLAVLLNERDLAYFTDTEEGSSGSAVCNDNWQVVALHKHSDPTLGTFNYQGKTTAWINTGTRIDLIIEDLRLNHAKCWKDIGVDGWKEK